MFGIIFFIFVIALAVWIIGALGGNKNVADTGA